MTGTQTSWRGRCVAGAMVAMLAACIASAQSGASPASQPTASVPASAPVMEQVGIKARVLEVKGDAEHAPIGGNDWQPCQVDDEYPAETKIRTGVRTAIKLQIGNEEPYTAVLIESVGLVSLSELAKTADSKRVRIGVGYGKIRAGVAEGGLKSDFTVDSPVATLSKRGTWNFGLSYDRGTDRFEIFLADYGLVEAIKKVTQERRTIQPGQAVTEAMRRWLDEVDLRRNVPIADMFGQEDVSVAFNRIDNDGLGVLGPGQGKEVFVNLTNTQTRQAFEEQLRRQLAASQLTGIGLEQPSGPTVRPEGFFGTGHGDQLIPLLIDRSASNGATKKATVYVRRSAAEAYLKKR